MADGQQAVDAAVADARRMQESLRSSRGQTVRALAELNQVRSAVRAWFGSVRPRLLAAAGAESILELDRAYQSLLSAANRRTLRSKYLTITRHIIRGLNSLETEHAAALAGGAVADESPVPEFGKLVGDLRMQKILAERWRECEVCVRQGAPLAAVVMIGGLLEGLLLARINQLQDKSSVYKAEQAPRDKSQRTKPINEWTLVNYIGVAHELGWITGTAKTLGEAIRDYRNLIHPQRELSSNLSMLGNDAQIIWQVAKVMMAQILEGSQFAV